MALGSLVAATFKKQMRAARKEYRTKRRVLEKQLAALDREYGSLFDIGRVGNNNPKPGRATSGRKYGAVRESVLAAIKSAKGIKPAQITVKTGLASAQVHNSLTGLKKDKLVRVKDGLYTAA